MHYISCYSQSYTFRGSHIREFGFFNESSASKSILQEYGFLEKSPKWWHSLVYFMIIFIFEKKNYNECSMDSYKLFYQFTKNVQKL